MWAVLPSSKAPHQLLVIVTTSKILQRYLKTKGVSTRDTKDYIASGMVLHSTPPPGTASPPATSALILLALQLPGDHHTPNCRLMPFCLWIHWQVHLLLWMKQNSLLSLGRGLLCSTTKESWKALVVPSSSIAWRQNSKHWTENDWPWYLGAKWTATQTWKMSPSTPSGMV